MPCQQGEPDLMAARKGALEATMQMDLWYTMVAGEVGELNERQRDLLREAEGEGGRRAPRARRPGGSGPSRCRDGPPRDPARRRARRARAPRAGAAGRDGGASARWRGRGRERRG